MVATSNTTPITVPTSLFTTGSAAKHTANMLDDWNDTETIRRIKAFVDATTTEGDALFVPEEERFVTIDMDGTMLCEMPMALACELYAELYVKQAEVKHPEYKDTDLYQTCVGGDLTKLYSLPYAEISKAFHTLLSHGAEGMSLEEFEAATLEFFARRRSEKFQLPYSQLVYKPMLQLVDYMTARGYKVYACSGSPLALLQVVCPGLLHIPREHAIGSSVSTHWVPSRGKGKGKFVIGTELAALNDKAAKPENIIRAIGRAPVIAIGNSDGDVCMLEYATSREAEGKPALAVLVRHDDDEREFAYDDRAAGAQAAATEAGWAVVSMKQDFRVVF